MPGQDGIDWSGGGGDGALRRAAALAARRGGRRRLWAEAGRPGEMQGAAEPYAHHTVELWCRSRVGAACQARTASIGAAMAAAARCGAAALVASRGGRRGLRGWDGAAR